MIYRYLTMGNISSIFEKGGRRDYTNYKRIRVTNSITKILEKIIRNHTEKQFKTCEEQCGFIAGRSCMDNIFTLIQLLEKAEAKEKEIHLIFIELGKAYDSVPKSQLY